MSGVDPATASRFAGIQASVTAASLTKRTDFGQKLRETRSIRRWSCSMVKVRMPNVVCGASAPPSCAPGDVGVRIWNETKGISHWSPQQRFSPTPGLKCCRRKPEMRDREVLAIGRTVQVGSAGEQRPAPAQPGRVVRIERKVVQPARDAGALTGAFAARNWLPP